MTDVLIKRRNLGTDTHTLAHKEDAIRMKTGVMLLEAKGADDCQ